MKKSEMREVQRDGKMREVCEEGDERGVWGEVV